MSQAEMRGYGRWSEEALKGKRLCNNHKMVARMMLIHQAFCIDLDIDLRELTADEAIAEVVPEGCLVCAEQEPYRG